jgi:hypothetical protein
MNTCPPEVIECIFEEVNGRDLKNLLLVSKKFNRIISDSARLMKKIVLNLDDRKDIGSSLLNSTRKYSCIAILHEKNNISYCSWNVILKMKDFVKYFQFQDCKLFENNYNMIYDLIGCQVEELKFVKCSIETPNGKYRCGEP